MKIKKLTNTQLVEKLEQAQKTCPGSVYHQHLIAEARKRGLIK